MYQWIALAFAMAEIGIIAYNTAKKREVPMMSVCICSALAIIFVGLHFLTRG